MSMTSITKSQKDAVKVFTPREGKTRAEWRREIREKYKRMKKISRQYYGKEGLHNA